MKSFVISENDSNQRLDKFVKKIIPSLPDSLLQKYIRLKRIKINKKKAQNSQFLCVGDLVELYINDEFFNNSTKDINFSNLKGKIKVVYEDENILLVDKKPGLVVHEDNNNEKDTLINRVIKYLVENGSYNPDNELSFTPALCNRIDRNTGGIVIIAKNAKSLRVINSLIKEKLIKKFYMCLTHGKVFPKSNTVKVFLRKNEKLNIVEVFNSPSNETKTAITKYSVIKQNENYSLVEVELLTGRTHQIRATFSHLGFPLVGDNKYGLNKDNQNTGFKYQALYSYKLIFDGKEKMEHLFYLQDKVFTIDDKNIFEKEYNELSNK